MMTKEEILAEMNEATDELWDKASMARGCVETHLFPDATKNAIDRAVKAFNQIHHNDEVDAYHDKKNGMVEISIWVY